MQVIVNFYANLRQVAGSRQAEFSVPPGSTLRQLIAEIIQRFPGMQTEMLTPQGELYQHIHVFVNGRDSTFLDGSLDHLLEPECTIAIFPPIGGG